MPRHNRRRDDGAAASRSASAEQRVSWRGDTWVVRTVAGAAATKTYRCPGCLQLIGPGLPHVVVWATGDAAGDDRRHWHAACWAARESRPPR